MNTEVTILAVGPYNPALAAHLEVDYEKVKPGQFIATEFFGCRSTGSSIELAHYLEAHIGKPETWTLDDKRIDRALQRAEDMALNDALLAGLDGVLEGEIAALCAFRRAGFTFFLRLRHT